MASEPKVRGYEVIIGASKVGLTSDPSKGGISLIYASDAADLLEELAADMTMENEGVARRMEAHAKVLRGLK